MDPTLSIDAAKALGCLGSNATATPHVPCHRSHQAEQPGIDNTTGETMFFHCGRVTGMPVSAA